MFSILIICLLLFSHFASDYLLSSDQYEEKRRETQIGFHKQHLWFPLISLAMTLAFISMRLFSIILSLSILFLILRLFFHRFRAKEMGQRALLLYISEQLLHVIVILSAYPALKGIKPNETIDRFISVILDAYPFIETINNINLLSFIALLISGYILSIRGGTKLSVIIINLPKKKYPKIDVQSSISQITAIAEQETAAAQASEKVIILDEPSKISDEERMKRYGRMIGIIERFIIITAILLGLYEIIVIVTAIKSIARFKEISNTTSDYFIIGTLASYSIAMFIGFILLGVQEILLGT